MEFLFDENDYFSNETLTKTYYLQDDASQYNDVMFDHAEGTEIQWKEGKNLAVRVETRKQRHKSTNKTRVVKKVVKCETFFNFFTPPVVPEEDDEEMDEEMDEDLDKQLEEDYEIGEHFKEDLVPNAIDWFTGKAALEMAGNEDFEDYDELEEGDEDEDDDDEEDDDEDEDEGAGAAKGAAKAPECKQQ